MFKASLLKVKENYKVTKVRVPFPVNNRGFEGLGLEIETFKLRRHYGQH